MTGGIMYDQKDIILLPFPYSDLTGSKRRPALIVSNDKLNTTQDRICCLITSQQPDIGVFIAKRSIEEGDLPFESWVKPQRIFTVNEKIIVKKLCRVSTAFHKSILQKIFELLD